jgi:hypothetical protein
MTIEEAILESVRVFVHNKAVQIFDKHRAQMRDELQAAAVNDIDQIALKLTHSMQFDRVNGRLVVTLEDKKGS